MGIQANAWLTINPSFTEPDYLMQYVQASGYLDLLADSDMRVRIGEDDLVVYMRQMNLRTKMASGTASANELPGVDIQASMFSAPTYQLRVRSQWDHHDIAAGGRWGFSVPDAYRLGGQQANFQLARDFCLYGANPANGEGLVNATSATAVNLPPDSNGNTTVITYDNGQMAFYLAQQVAAIKTRTYQHGMGREFTLIGPQRTLSSFQYNVVQLVQFQRPGAGTASTAETLKKIMESNDDKLTWCYDDTLVGQGNGGADLVIISMPKVANPAMPKMSTNIFANKMKPGTDINVTMYADMVAPREIISPMAGGATDMVQEWRITPGWAVRGQALQLISMTY
jgi:hypothetical protein